MRGVGGGVRVMLNPSAVKPAGREAMLSSWWV